MNAICTDNRFELIEKFKKRLIESTNIETRQEEMKVLDNILFRFWQMGWLDSIDRKPYAEPKRLTDDDFETIRIHLNAQKEKLCNQQRWKEAEEYQRIIDRFMAFAAAEPERKKGKWDDIGGVIRYGCPFCHHSQERKSNFCPNCGADMRGEQE